MFHPVFLVETDYKEKKKITQRICFKKYTVNFKYMRARVLQKLSFFLVVSLSFFETVSLCSPALNSLNLGSFCLNLLNAEITGMYHHTQLSHHSYLCFVNFNYSWEINIVVNGKLPLMLPRINELFHQKVWMVA